MLVFRDAEDEDDLLAREIGANRLAEAAEGIFVVGGIENEGGVLLGDLKSAGPFLPRQNHR